MGSTLKSDLSHFKFNPFLAQRQFISLVVISLILLLILYRCLDVDYQLSSENKLYLYEKWSDCMRDDMNTLEQGSTDQFISGFTDLVKKCDLIPIIKNLPIVAHQNQDEVKYSIYPIQKNTEMNIVTLGVGQDVRAEQQIKSDLQDIPTNFYGADPIVKGNSELYSSIGTFYPFAISNSTLNHDSSVLVDGTYKMQTVKHVEFIQFLKEMVKKPFIDLMLIDAELAEYGLMDYFYRGGPLDANNITVCQFNLEVHGPLSTYKKKIKEFLLTLFKDQRYGFFRVVHIYHLRLYFINLTDPKCLLKYLIT